MLSFTLLRFYPRQILNGAGFFAFVAFSTNKKRFFLAVIFAANVRAPSRGCQLQTQFASKSYCIVENDVVAKEDPSRPCTIGNVDKRHLHDEDPVELIATIGLQARRDANELGHFRAG